MADVLVLVAHPDIARSRVNRALAAQARLLPSEAVEVRDLYALYPDYVIDVEAEQAALAQARTVVWLHPVQWYSMPALMKLWVDDVLAFRWAYGPGGRALVGKCLWLVVSTGGSETSYQDGRQQPPPVRRLPARVPADGRTGGHALPRTAGVLRRAQGRGPRGARPRARVRAAPARAGGRGARRTPSRRCPRSGPTNAASRRTTR